MNKVYHSYSVSHGLISGLFGVDPKGVARISASAIAKYLAEGSGVIKDIFLTDIAPKKVMLLQEAVEGQSNMELLDSFRGKMMCLTDPFSFQPPGDIRGARGVPSKGSAGHTHGRVYSKGGQSRSRAGYSGRPFGYSGGSRGYSGGSGSYSGGSGSYSGGSGCFSVDSSGYSGFSRSGREGIKGKQPTDGQMQDNLFPNSLEGVSCGSCIEITYTFSAGHQGVSI